MPAALLAAFKQAKELERRTTEAEQRASESQQQVAELNRVLDAAAASFEQLKQEHAATLDELAWHKRWAFGRRRERFIEGKEQGHLFELNPSFDDEPEDPATLNEEAEVEVKTHRRRKKREIDWDKLRQIHHEHDLADEEKACTCCGRTMDRIGEDVTRELEYEPAKLEAHIHTRPKYACRHCKDSVSAAPLPPRPIPGGIAGPGLITEVIVGKFGDHLPLHRLEDILARYGVYISRSTMCGWVKAAAGLFRPLYDLQREQALRSSMMWTDDTRVTVLCGDGSVDARHVLRLREAVPVLDKLEVYLTKLARDMLPKSSLAKAVNYASNQWEALRRYTEDGRLSIDNNVSERTLRHQAVGRKNWLFLGSEAAGPRAAVLYTILAGAKRHRIEPWAYVRDLLLRLNADDAHLEEMLPENEQQKRLAGESRGVAMNTLWSA